jgi:hypothetical protein
MCTDVGEQGVGAVAVGPGLVAAPGTVGQLPENDQRPGLAETMAGLA